MSITAHPNAAHQKKSRPVQRDLRVELCGNYDDPAFLSCFNLLRSYRLRYQPLIRPYFTAVGRGDGERTTAAVVNFAEEEEKTLMSHFACGDTAAVTVERLAVLRRLHQPPSSSSDGSDHLPEGWSGESWLRNFLDYHLLPIKLVHSWQQQQQQQPVSQLPPAAAAEDCSSLSSPIFFRHYVHEGSRTASFLVGHLQTKRAVVVDPPYDLEQIHRDISRFDLRVVAVCLTHMHVDARTGHKELFERWKPDCEMVWCGALWPHKQQQDSSAAPADVHIGDVMWELQLGSLPLPTAAAGCTAPMRLRGIWAPAATDDSMVFELWIGEQRVVVLSGISIPVDGWARSDLRTFCTSAAWLNNGRPPMFIPRTTVPASAPPYTPPSGLTEGDGKLHATLRWVICEYFGGSMAPRADLDGAIVFPSHGGYNHITHQLDLHWAAHVGDLKRYAHVKKIYELLLTAPPPTPAMDGRPKRVLTNSPRRPPTFQTYLKALPLLPKCRLFVSNYRANVSDATVGEQADGRERSTPPPPSDHYRSDIVIDVRPFPCYVAGHLRGSVNIPMTFPGDAFGAKKAELWLACTLGPQYRRVTALCETNDQIVPTRMRFLQVGVPEDSLQVLSAQSYRPESWNAIAVVENPSPAAKAEESAAASVAEAALHPGNNKRASPWARLSTVSSLQYLSVSPTTLVVDVRTPYEYKNGSHRSSVHFALADLCAMFSDPSIPPHALALRLLTQLHDNAIVGGADVCHRLEEVRHVIVYCAAGYRSHIAVSMIKAAIEQCAPAGETAATLLSQLSVVDVAGGALHIMMHRPDVWIVKDRSIVCIS